MIEYYHSFSMQERKKIMRCAPSQEPKAEILVIDDDPENVHLLTAILRWHGYGVRCAFDGVCALQSVRKALPDLILLDIMMPYLDGHQVCEQLKADEHTCHVPVVFVSALDDPAEIAKSFALGGVAYINKPFQPEDLVACVESHLAMLLLERIHLAGGIRLHTVGALLQGGHQHISLWTNRRDGPLKANHGAAPS